MRGWGEGHLEAELFQAPDRPTLHALPIALVEIVVSQILIRSVTREQVVANGENRVADSQNSPFAASARRNPMILGRQILLFCPCRSMRGFGEGTPQLRTVLSQS